MTLTIPSPVLSGGHFTVTIKNSAGITVYGPSAQTNAAFDPGLSTPDEYTVIVDNAGAVNGFCFTIPPCTTCPTLSEVTLEEGTPPIFYGYAHFKFDMSGGFQCPFVIRGNVSDGSVFNVTINSLTDFTSHIGSIYDKTIWIGGDSNAISYQIGLANGIICSSGNVAPACDGPKMPSTTVRIVSPTAGVYAIQKNYNDCGSTCHTMVWNYIQTSDTTGLPPDMGTFTDTVPCPATGMPSNHLIHPAGYLPGTTVTYHVTATDCCGIVQSFDISYNVPCSGPTIPPTLSIVLIAGVYYLRAVYVDCGTDCHDANFSAIQNNTLSSGTGEAFVNNSNVIPCAGPFPLTIDYPLHPHLDIIVGTNIRYVITFTNCCGENADSVLVTYPL